MRVQSPLSNLRDILAQVRSSAINYQSTLKCNEAATRAVLVDPVLRALGWDTSNTYMVEVEKTLNQTRADYALYENAGKVKIIIEAKKLYDSLSQHDVKLVSYAFTFQLESIFLTDGINWLHYTDFQPAHFAPTRILNIANDDLVEVASYLVQHLDAAKLWPEDQTVDALSSQLSQLQSDFATLQRDISLLKLSSGSQAPAIRLPKPGVAIPQNALTVGTTWTSLEAVKSTVNLKPKLIRLPDGQELKISSWKQILIEAVKFALANNPSIGVPLPDRFGQKVNLLSDTPMPDNISQLSLTHKGQAIYVYTNYSSSNCVANAAYILHLVPATMKPTECAVLLV